MGQKLEKPSEEGGIAKARPQKSQVDYVYVKSLKATHLTRIDRKVPQPG